ncbi:MAG: cobD, partial [Friedmanniella sp.]|nr:cobD [Friedmanniella sp.]
MREHPVAGSAGRWRSSPSTVATRLAPAAGLILGFVIDRLVGDPRRGHPVAGFGRLALALEARTYADRRSAGVLHLAVLLTTSIGAATAVDRLTRRRPMATAALTAAATWAVLGGRSLSREVATIADQLDRDDLAAARVQVRNLVGRETSGLSADEVARAALESLAENTSDAVVAPLLWGAVAGLPGLVGYRVANTLDAMVGHRSPRYLRFGWAAARFDDVLNWGPARVAGVVAALAAPLVGGRATDGWRTVRRDATQHPSPNAGVVEAAFAGALGVRLGGRNVYHGQVEDRGVLGDGRPVRVTDLARADLLARVTGVAVLLVAVGVS